MAKLPRVFQKIFSWEAPLGQVGQFGSFSEGAPLKTKDPTAIQGLANWVSGWYSAVRGAYSPTIQDMNGVFLVLSYQLAYLMQQGIAEWNDETEYHLGSMVNLYGVIYVSLANTNTDNPLSDTTKWKIYGKGVRTVTATGAITTNDDIIRCDGAADVTLTLPEISTSINKTFTIKNVGDFVLDLKGNGAELIDGVNKTSDLDINPLAMKYGSISVFNNGTTWDIL